MEKIITEQMQTQRNDSCQVCVCGGGIAGIAAALAAARAGADVLLLEKGYMLGGLATAGLVTIYLPICDGMGHQICFGIAEELLRLSIAYGAEDKYPAAWLDGGSEEQRKKARFLVQFNAQLFAISAEQLLRKAGVRILYGASVAAVHTENQKITDIIIEGKSGREAVAVSRAVVDATGDADVCRLAGEKTEIFQEGNKLAAWYYGFGDHDYKLYMCGVHDLEDSANKDTQIKVDRQFGGLETRELSDMVQLSHQYLISDVLKRRARIPDLLPVTISTIPAVRMTRRLSGAATPDIEESYVNYADSVGIYPNWRKRGPVYELPFSALYGNEIKNLIAAGRCISVADAMWDITRAIPVCAVSGEAAGAAAAMSDDFAQMDVTQLQQHLTKQGVLLHYDNQEG